MKKSIFIVFMCLVISLCSCKNRYAEKPVHNDIISIEQIESDFSDRATESTAGDITESNADNIENEADRISEKYGSAGVSAAVIKDGKLYMTYEYGYQNREKGIKVTPDTKFRVASLSKLAADSVFMILKDEGKLSDKEDIGKYLGYKLRNPSYPDTPLTGEMLMCHISSLRDTDSFYQSRNAGSSVPFGEILSSPHAFSSAAPGTEYIYSNMGVAVIGAACEKVLNKNFGLIADEKLFKPLNIDAAFTASEIENKDKLAVLYGHGGLSIDKQLSERFSDIPGQTHHLVQGNLTISAEDYIKIIAMLVNGGINSEGKRILSEESAESILSNHFSAGKFGCGYGVQIQDNVIPGKTLCVHTGSNFGMFSAFAFSPDEKSGVVVLTSGAEGSKNQQNEIYSVCLDLIKLLYP